MDELLSQVREIFAEVTRYPVEILEPGADLEEDLGIDSVKRAEILTVFMDRFGLPEDFEVEPDELRTIASITEILRRHVPRLAAAPPAALPRENGLAAVAEHTAHAAELGNGAAAAMRGNGAAAAASGNGSAPPRSSWEPAPQHHVPPAPSRSRPAAPVGRAAAVPPLDEVREVVLATIAELSGCPRDMLTLDADLEDDLGIDSARLARVLAVLRDRLGLGDTMANARVNAHTVGEIVSTAEQLFRREAPAVPRTTTAGAGALPSRPAAGPAAFLGAHPFAGKIALVTGSGHGIGKAIALRLSELGARVVVNSFHSRERGEQTAREIEAAGGEAVHVWGSVAKPEQIRRLFGEVEQRYGRLDFLVCNASNGMIAPLDRITEEHWERAFRTNVLSLHQGAMLAAPLMRPHGGRIVALSSPGAQRYIEYFGCMGPIKAAVESLVRYLAIELAPYDIQVNAVSAGPIYGELLSKYPDSDRLIPYWESLSVGKRLGEEGDVANFVAYLLSEAAAKISGSVLLLDSGGSQRI
jgi:NAD(P)-dependent dehydrogenase (short-subunit alcohol dehydrogenase family)/acyl carrier protein